MADTSFGGLSFDSLGIVVERVRDYLTDLTDDSEDKDGDDGSIYRCVYIPSREITLECRAFEDTWADFDALIDTLMVAFLSDREERELRVRTRPGTYYMAHFTGYDEGDREGGTGIGGFTLTFVASDPHRYSDSERTANIPSAGSVTFTVGGTVPCLPKVQSSVAIRDSTSKLWGVKLDNAVHLRVSPSTTSRKAVSIDCASRAVTIDNATSMITLDSNWFEMPPGEHTVAMDEGTGAATITWRERWL